MNNESLTSYCCKKYCPVKQYMSASVCSACSTNKASNYCNTKHQYDCTSTSSYLDNNSCKERCPSGTTQEDNGKCVTTISNCRVILNSVCVACNAGYYLDSSNNCVNTPITGCTTFSTLGCQECNANYHLNVETHKCTACSTTIARCSECKYQGKEKKVVCSTCSANSYLSSNTCPACDTNCVSGKCSLLL